MKIWFPLITAGSGSDVYTVRLANSLDSYGIKTEVTRFSKYFEFAPSLLRRYQPSMNPDIVHTNSWNGFAFRRHGALVVTTVHLPVLDPCYNKYKNVAQNIYHQLMVKRFEKTTLNSANRTVTVSEFVKRSIAETYGTGNIETIYNYVDTDFFSPREKLPLTNNRPFRLLFIGNLTRRKGADLLEPIMNRLGKDFHLTATTGLRQHNYRLEGSNILQIGRLDGIDLVNAYQQADALIFPTRLEGFGYSALEAMACGTPVIASNNSSLPEVVQHKKTGILCETDNVEEFVEACRVLRNNPSRVAAYGAAAREWAVSYFSERVVVTKYINMYKNLLKQSGIFQD